MHKGHLQKVSIHIRCLRCKDPLPADSTDDKSSPSARSVTALNFVDEAYCAGALGTHDGKDFCMLLEQLCSTAPEQQNAADMHRRLVSATQNSSEPDVDLLINNA